MAEKITFDQLSWQPPTAEQKILDQLSGSFERGFFYALLGPNGAGKTTLLRVLNGFMKADSGSVQVDGRDLHSLNRREIADLFAYLPQQSESGLELPVAEIIRMARYRYLSLFEDLREEDERAVREAVARCQCENLLEKNFATLSGGERQRVLCARAIAQESSFIFLDEPVSNLDLKYQHSILETLQRLSRDKKVGLISVMHDINLAATYCERIYLMKAGKCVRFGQTEEVLQADLLSAVYEWPIEKISSASTSGEKTEESYFQARPGNRALG